MIKLQQPTEKNSDILSTNLKLLQIIEKHNLPVRIGRGKEFLLQGTSSNFYAVGSANEKFIMAIDLPMTKDQIKTGSDFDTSALKDFLNLENIFTNPITEVISVSKKGENFKAERFHLIENIGQPEFNLVDSEDFELLGYSYQHKEFYFAHEPNEKKEQITLYVEFNPYIMLLNDTIISINDSKSLVVSNVNLIKLNKTMSNPDDLYNIILCSLQTLAELSKFRDLKINGSFQNLVGYYLERQLKEELIKVSDITFKTNQDLSKNRLDILLIEPQDDIKMHTTITSFENSINPLDTRTYSKFLYTEDDLVVSRTAYEILPVGERAPNIIELKKQLPNNNSFRTIKAELFLPDGTPTSEEMQTLYKEWIQIDKEALQQKWNAISERLNKYTDMGFVPKIALALVFIKKYFWSYYKYSYNHVQESTIPILFTYLINVLEIDIAEFFGIHGYEAYFTEMVKAPSTITQLDRHNGRLNKMGTIKGSINSYYGGFNRSMYFTRSVISQPTPTSVGYNNPLIHLIINDSYTKQAWKPKIKKYVKDIGIPTENNQVFILTTQNKLETMLLKRVLRDRPLVYQFSNFEAKVKVVRQNRVIETKTFKIDARNVHDVSKRRLWRDDPNLNKGEFDNQLYIPYSAKNGFIFGGKYHSIKDNSGAFQRWDKIIRTYCKKRITLVSEKDLKRIQTDHTVPMFEQFLETDEFKKHISTIANNKLFLENREQFNTMYSFLQILQDYFIRFIYTSDAQSSSVNLDRNKLAEHLFYQFVKNMRTPVLRDVTLKLIPYFPKKVNNYYTQSHFMSFLDNLPMGNTFDEDIFKEIAKERAVTFTVEEFEIISTFNERFQSVQRRENLGREEINNLFIALISLLRKSNNINLNKEDQDIIMDSRVNIYLLTFLGLLKLT